MGGKRPAKQIRKYLIFWYKPKSLISLKMSSYLAILKNKIKLLPNLQK